MLSSLYILHEKILHRVQLQHSIARLTAGSVEGCKGHRAVSCVRHQLKLTADDAFGDSEFDCVHGDKPEISLRLIEAALEGGKGNRAVSFIRHC